MITGMHLLMFSFTNRRKPLSEPLIRTAMGNAMSFSLKPIQQLIKHYNTRSVDCMRSSNIVDILTSP
ncbi:hypothetical protein PVAP13_3KG135300 [Panicum virgatum]|uniref:Uncharacterized protein n=1 Tax=Panicum virgatum TaxID=38727 RepID=A0A8T0UTQ1_PANVG|nr:hypothetical protein PVAP13_3KG135300 [Panicum virgatum]